MNQTKSRILSIDPGTYKMGYALLDGEELLYHGVRVLKNRQSPHENLQEGRLIVLNLIKLLEPTVLAVEKTFINKNRQLALLNVLGDEIRSIGRRKGLRVVSYAPTTVKKFITGHGWATKDQVAQVIVRQYPDLEAYLIKDRQWKQLHHANMFDAVALGLVARHHL